GRRVLALALRLRRLCPLARPRLVELHPPLPVLALLEREARAEGAARATAEPGHGPRRPAGRDQLSGDGHGELLARLALPDHKAAPRVLARPARVALAVLVDVAAAHRTGPEVRARDPHVLEL